MTGMEQRVAQLERDCRRLRTFNGCLLAAGLGLICIAAAPATPLQQPAADGGAGFQQPVDPAGVQTDRERRPLTLEAERLILVDAQRRPRLQMVVTDEGPAIRLLDAQGNPRVALSESPSRSGLQLIDGQGHSIGALSVVSDSQQPQLELRSGSASTLTRPEGYFVRDAKDQNSLYLALINGNFPVCGISSPDAQHGPAVEITSSGGTGRIKIHDPHGRPLFTVGTVESGTAELTLSQTGSERSLSISGGSLESNGPTMTFFGPAQADGSGGILPRLVLGMNPESKPFLRISGSDGRPVYTAP